MNPERWRQRFDNYQRAFRLLSEALEKVDADLSDLEKEGVVQRFEYTSELAWKTMKDYLEFSGVVFDEVTPKRVLKEAYRAGIVPDGQTWIDLIDHRNLMSHTYDKKLFDDAVAAIRTKYLQAFSHVHAFSEARAGAS